MKTVVFLLAILMAVTVCFAEDNGLTEISHSDSITGSAADTLTMSLSMSGVTFFGLSIVLDSLNATSDSIGGKFRTLRRYADRLLPVGTPFTPILWQTGEFPTDTSRWIVTARDNSYWRATNINPYTGEAIQFILDTPVNSTDSIPYVLELQKTDGAGW